MTTRNRTMEPARQPQRTTTAHEASTAAGLTTAALLAGAVTGAVAQALEERKPEVISSQRHSEAALTAATNEAYTGEMAANEVETPVHVAAAFAGGHQADRTHEVVVRPPSETDTSMMAAVRTVAAEAAPATGGFQPSTAASVQADSVEDGQVVEAVGLQDPDMPDETVAASAGSAEIAQILPRAAAIETEVADTLSQVAGRIATVMATAEQAVDAGREAIADALDTAVAAIRIPVSLLGASPDEDVRDEDILPELLAPLEGIVGRVDPVPVMGQIEDTIGDTLAGTAYVIGVAGNDIGDIADIGGTATAIRVGFAGQPYDATDANDIPVPQYNLLQGLL